MDRRLKGCLWQCDVLWLFSSASTTAALCWGNSKEPPLYIDTIRIKIVNFTVEEYACTRYLDSSIYAPSMNTTITKHLPMRTQCPQTMVLPFRICH
jgi:hypothetical protein